MTTFNRQLKIKTNKTYDGWDWTMDGQYNKPRVKGKDKKARTRYSRTLEKQYTQQELDKISKE